MEALEERLVQARGPRRAEHEVAGERRRDVPLDARARGAGLVEPVEQQQRALLGPRGAQRRVVWPLVRRRCASTQSGADANSASFADGHEVAVERVHDDLREQPRLARGGARGEQRTPGTAAVEAGEPREERRRVAHGERPTLGVLALDRHLHALGARVEPLARERVDNGRVLEAHHLEVPPTYRLDGDVIGHRRQLHGRGGAAEGEQRLQRTGDARDIVRVQRGHLLLVALAGKGGPLDAALHALDAAHERLLVKGDGHGGGVAAEREHLGRQCAEGLAQARVGVQPHGQLAAHP
eukprot:7380961-Prymnesium_polylepis.2